MRLKIKGGREPGSASSRKVDAASMGQDKKRETLKIKLTWLVFTQ